MFLLFPEGNRFSLFTAVLLEKTTESQQHKDRHCEARDQPHPAVAQRWVEGMVQD